MVKIRLRGDPPAVLARHRDRWTAKWMDCCQSKTHGDWATRTAKQAIKPTLRQMTHGKCAFCETIVETFAHIEHWIAKSVEPHRVFEWENLFLACADCNGCKGEIDHGGLLLKPDTDDPEQFFWIDPEGELQPHPSLDPEAELRVRRTIQILRLNECGALKNQRRQYLLELSKLLDLSLRNKISIEDLKECLELQLDPRKPFKLVLRATIPAIAEEDRRRYHA